MYCCRWTKWRQNKNTQMHAYARPIRTDSSNSKFWASRRACLRKWLTELGVNGRPHQTEIRCEQLDLLWFARRWSGSEKGTLVVRPTNGGRCDNRRRSLLQFASSLFKITAGKTRKISTWFFVRKIGLWSLFYASVVRWTFLSRLLPKNVHAACRISQAPNTIVHTLCSRV